MPIEEPRFKKCVWCHVILNQNNREPGCKQYCRRCAHHFMYEVYRGENGDNME